jgi:hypothetical protein
MAEFSPVWELWNHLRDELLPTERMVRLLGGEGRVYTATQTLPDREGPEGSVWGRVVISPTDTLWRSSSAPNETRKVSFLLRVEVPHIVQEPMFDPGRLLDAVQAEAYSLLNGYAPADPFRHIMVALPIYAWSPPQSAPLLDEARGVFYTSGEYRTEVVPSNGVP